VFKDYTNNYSNGSKASDLVLCLLLLLEEYGVTFEYLQGKKNLSFVADALSCLGIDSLKFKEEEAKILLSGSESRSIINFKLTSPMYTAFIFKEQAKDNVLRENGNAQPHYSIQHIEGFDILCYKEKTYIPQSLRQTTKITVLVP
jgi:hypothetical protein